MATQRRRPPATMRRWGFRLGAVLIGLSPLVAAEIALRGAGVAARPESADPFVGFRRLQPLFELDRSAGKYRTAGRRRSFFGLQEFAQPKPPGGLRVFCLGGSTVLGHPFQTDTAFTNWLALQCAGNEPGRSIEVVNCGGISYASYRLRPILQEVLQYQPDAIILATGHNEFLEDRTYRSVKHAGPIPAFLRTATSSLRLVAVARKLCARGSAERSTGRTVLPEEVDARLDHESGYASYHRDDNWNRAVVEHFRHNVLAMAQECRCAGVPIVLVRLGSNLRDCPPFKAEPSAELSPADLDRWQAACATALRRECEDPETALAEYQKAAALDPRHPLVQYRIGCALDRLGRFAEAKAAYQRACDWDICPLRMTAALHDALTSVIETAGAAVVDARALLEQASPQGIPGNDWFLDHVHPNVSGHQLIAEALFERLVALGVARRSPDWNAAARRSARRVQLERLGARYFAQGKLRVEWLDHWARRDRLRSAPAEEDHAAWLRLGHAYLDFADWPAAETAYRRGLRAADARPQLRAHVERLRDRGQVEDAERLERLLRELQP